MTFDVQRSDGHPVVPGCFSQSVKPLLPWKPPKTVFVRDLGTDAPMGAADRLRLHITLLGSTQSELRLDVMDLFGQTLRYVVFSGPCWGGVL